MRQELSDSIIETSIIDEKCNYSENFGHSLLVYIYLIMLPTTIVIKTDGYVYKKAINEMNRF